MPDWFIMVVIASKLTFVGPFGEGECRTTKHMMFPDRLAVCVQMRPEHRA